MGVVGDTCEFPLLTALCVPMRLPMEFSAMFSPFIRVRYSLRVTPFFCWFLLSFSLLSGGSHATAQPHIDLTALRPVWYGMYFGKDKVGYTSINFKTTRYQNQPAIEMNSDARMKLRVLGSEVEQISTQQTFMDVKGRILREVMDIRSQASRIHLEADFNYKSYKAECRFGTSDEKNKKTLDIPRDATIIGDTNLPTLGAKMRVGQRLTQYYLDPISITFQKAIVDVTGRAKVRDLVTGRVVEVFVTTSNLSQMKMTSYEGEKDGMLRAEMGIGPIQIVMQREPKERALNTKDFALLSLPNRKGNAYVPPKDFAVATAIVADKTIEDPRKVRSLDVTISGIPHRDLVLSDDSQQVEITKEAKGAVEAEYHIRSTEFDASQSLSLPLNDTSLQPYLSKAPYLDIENPAIVDVARKIRGDEKSLYKIATAIRDWVSNSMIPDPSIGVPRSATDIFNYRRGVCRDYATLFTAIARAAGVPTRLCAGIVYAEGRFYYHAWVECYTGKWVVLDPTLYSTKSPTSYVDATHIKFAQGDVIEMFKSTAVVGKLGVKVLRFSN